MQALTALLGSENHTDQHSLPAVRSSPSHLPGVVRCVYSSGLKHNLSHSRTKKWENFERNESLNLLGHRSTGSQHFCASTVLLHTGILGWDCFSNSLSHKRALAPHGPARTEPAGQTGCDLFCALRGKIHSSQRNIAGARFCTHPTARSTRHVMSEEGL